MTLAGSGMAVMRTVIGVTIVSRSVIRWLADFTQGTSLTIAASRVEPLMARPATTIRPSCGAIA